ncbi:hypothetical protein PPL_02791 [Heterostelium album PN500]|uniref:MD-2-related lipid-recognition domain-containing protein n=1 Tax=Heterostelium pallidum (strain ATCC 26659 / Pp 5 / PN500) TaxID=670386 RepID=D3B326_HETP5|nr:hypothetical protein PPL_02791 [Heterostelium album PN500]EFA83724.1 hypothetical protein PPL_02791 [Heterostelium album PN500]|eukprot:XP_020435841.1 hypothetical protein PPL_02791 [Heterostelium album PN500]
MKSISIFVFVVLVLSVVNADIWSNCGNPNDIFQISSVSIVPDPPAKGKDLTVTIGGSLSETLTGGNAHVSVKYGFITILNKDEPICQTNSPIPCPIEAGPLSKTFTAAIPSNTPSGSYKANIVITDQNKSQIACINVNLKF